MVGAQDELIDLAEYVKELERERDALAEALRKSREAIHSLDINALGVGYYTETNGESVPYPLKEELMDEINKALAMLDDE